MTFRTARDPGGSPYRALNGGAMRSTKPTPEPTRRGAARAVSICDRCGDICIDAAPCRCRTPYDQTEVRRRHRDAVARAQASAKKHRSRRDASPAA